jgi:flagellar hook-basal body complex protein FliE
VSPLEFGGLSLLEPTRPLEGPGSTSPAADAAGASFASILSDVVSSANQRIEAAQQAANAFAAGGNDDIHGTMLALSKADVELRMVGSIRTKVVDAFYELWRMQV